MQPLDKMKAREWLGAQGVVPASWIDSVIDAFDFSAPAPEIRQFDTGDVIYQYTGNPSFYNAAPNAGSWYCLQGAQPEGLAIFSGLAGRTLHRFVVERPFAALEGRAAPKSKMSSEAVRLDFWRQGIGGSGGVTQIFVPPSQRPGLRGEGPANAF